jgi:hypothetical protein
VFISAAIGAQVNPLTNERIEHGKPSLVVYDRWIEIQLEAKVLSEHPMS